MVKIVTLKLYIGMCCALDVSVNKIAFNNMLLSFSRLCFIKTEMHVVLIKM